MPIGIIVNALSVAVGGAIGMLFGSKVPEKIKTELIQIFGVCSMDMGISSIVLMKYMPAVVFSVVVGSAIGLTTGLGTWVNKGAAMMQKPVARLFTKSILDFFTALVFASNLGMVVSFISIPQCLIFLVIFVLAKFIYPMTTPDMIADFKACGGFLLLATGLRIAKIKLYSTADMIPAMVLVMPVSWFWANCILPLL